MKKSIHPNYYKDAKAICACGHVFTVGSTEKEIKTELCSVCHPFYTGKQKLVDTARRVEKFNAKVKASTDKKVDATAIPKKAKRAARTAARVASVKSK